MPSQPDRPLRPAPEPLDVDAVWPVATGTVLWLIGFLVLLPFYRRLVDAGHEVWLWTCLAGFGLGLIGLPLCLRQRAAVRRTRAAATAAARPPEPTTAPPDPPPAQPPDGG